METAIGVFDSTDRATQAVRALLANDIPQDSINFLTRSNADAATIGKQLSSGKTLSAETLTEVTGVSAGAIAASTLLIPGGVIIGIGLGAATLLGLIGAESGKASVAEFEDDANLFRSALDQGRSLIVVRTKSIDTARSASGILDRLGLSLPQRSADRPQTSVRKLGDVAVVDMAGRITSGEGHLMLRDIVRNLLAQGHKKILLNLHGVDYVDSIGIGELVETHTFVNNQGARLKLCNLSSSLSDLLHKNKLHSLFDIHPDESSAVHFLDHR